MALLALLLMVNEGSASAQGTTPERGFQPGGSYSVSDIETVSTTGGNMMLHFPVGKLPAGRAELGAALSLNYDSKLYDSYVSHEADPYATPIPNPPPGQSGDVVVERNILRQSDGGGWHYTFGYNLEIVNRDDQYGFGYTPQYPDQAAISRWKVRVIFPDGSPHDFILRGFDAEDRLHDGYSDVRPDGYRSWWAGGGCWPQQCIYVDDTPYYSGTLTYYSTDGTYARLDIQHDSDSTVWNNPWTLFLPDGTRVVNGTRIYDRNNNYVEMGFTQLANGHYAEVLTDQLGRSVTLEYEAAANEDDIHVKGFGGEELLYRVKWKTVMVNKSYPTCMCSSNGLPAWIPNQRVVYEIDMPAQTGGLQYTFGYNAADYVYGSSTPSYGWGELSSITLPSGAQVAYQYVRDGVNSAFDWQEVMQNTMGRKDLTYNREYDGTSTPVTETWLYTLSSRIGLPSPFTSTIVNPDGGTLVESGEQYGHVYKSVQPDGTVVERLWRQNVPQGFVAPITPSYSGVNWYVKTEFTSIRDAGGNLSKTAIKDYDYDKNGNVTQVREYDWVAYAGVPRDSQGNPTGVPAGAPLKRVSQSKYLYPTPDASDSTTASGNLYAEAGSSALHALVAATEVSNGSQTLSRSEFTYDANGNLTQQRSWDSTKGGYGNPLSTANSVSVSYQYDGYGNRTLATDAKGNQTQYTYGSVAGFTGLYPTQVTSAYGTAVAMTTTAEYDFYTGLATRSTDPNNVATSTSYDPFGRPTLVRAAEDRSEEARTQIVYSDAARRVITRKDLSTAGDGKLVSIVHYDQLGRVRLTRQLEDASTQSETDETQGVKLQTRYAYSGSNSYQLVSNPYRAAYSYQAGGTMGWTRSKSDNGGRVAEVQTFAGSSLPAPWGTNGSSAGAVTTAYDAEFTTVTDQAGKVRRSVMNALGQLARVDEPDGNGNLGATSSPVQPTYYTYDALGNLRKVDQGGQLRYFMYDSLGRLIRAKNPEQTGNVSADADFPSLTDTTSGTSNGDWSMGYTYDADGNLAKRKDTRNVVTTYTYDNLNRVTQTSYSDGTATHIFGYDSATNGRGRIAYVYDNSTSGGVNSVTGYDAMGRPTRRQTDFFLQGTGWVSNYAATRTYDLAGNVTSETYPSGHTVTYSYDVAGRLADNGASPAFAGNLGDGTQRTYATGVSYDEASRMQQEQFGTQTPLYHKLHYNVRGQLYDVRLSTQSMQANEWDWNRGAVVNYYGGAAWQQSSTTNNGNLTIQQSFVPADDAISSYNYTQQSYQYDSLNRLSSVSETNNSGVPAVSQAYSYDRWGNRQLNSAPTPDDGINHKQFAIDTATNRIGVPTGQSGSIQYDNAGNITFDNYTDPSKSVGTRTYDAENRMTSAQGYSGLSGVFTEQYVYDAEGHRARRKLGSGETWQIYGFDGELLAEYSAAASPSSPQKEYGYRNGELLVMAAPPATGSLVNVASAAQGATASASSYDPDNTFCAGTHTRPSDAIDGVRAMSEVSCGTGYWRAHPLPGQWLEVDFSGAKSISEVDVYTPRDNYTNQSDPTAGETFSLYGVSSYDLQYWDGSAWVAITGGSVSGNNLVWRKLTFSSVVTTKLRLNVTGAVDGVARITELEAWGTAAQSRTNVASSSQGATATAQNYTQDGVYAGLHFQPAYANDGVRYIHPPDGDQYWRDEHGLASWVQIDFAGSKTIDEVDVYTVADYPAFLTQAGPSSTQTFTQFGATAFDVQYWTGSAWANVPGGSMSGNNLVWKKINFSAVTTSKIRVVVNAAVDGVARIAEVEAYTPGSGAGQGAGASAEVNWLVSDHLGTPRMVVDQTGSLTGVKRHDYLPFGEEIQAGVGGRTQSQGYSQPDGVRQKFTSAERDDETGLDFMQARYYGSTMGRFTSVDPYDINMERQYAEDDAEANRLLRQYIGNPQHWNHYGYALNNPLRYVDPSGEKEDEIIARVNIVYDKDTIKTEEAAKKLTAATVADAIKTYATAGIKLEVTYTAGTATGNGNIYSDGLKITEGKVDGAVNIFISENRNQSTGGISNPNTGESFINYGAGAYGLPRDPDVGILAHELGHQFGVNSPPSKLGTLGDYANNISDDNIIDGVNAALRRGETTMSNLGPQHRDDYPFKGQPIPIPTIKIYREGARRFSRR
jgi:RHS repeat-associated protein